MHRHCDKNLEGHVTTRSVIAYELREVVRKGKKWELGGMYMPTAEERFD